MTARIFEHFFLYSFSIYSLKALRVMSVSTTREGKKEYANPLIRAFFTKFDDPPMFLFKFEITTTSANGNVKVQR